MGSRVAPWSLRSFALAVRWRAMSSTRSAPPPPAAVAMSSSASSGSSSGSMVSSLRSPSSTTVTALALGAGVGAAAASSLFAAWNWWQARSQAQGAEEAARAAAADRNKHPPNEHTHEPRFSSAANAASSSAYSLAVPGQSGARTGRGTGTGSPSRSRALRHDPESSVSRRLSDAGSYLEDREYEGDHHQLAKTLNEEAGDGDADQNDDDAVTAALRHSQHHQHDADEDDDEQQQAEPEIYMCPHCSNYINPHELIIPSLEEQGDSDSDGREEDEEGRADVAFHRAQSAQAARILSAAEQLSIQQALRDSLHQIFVSVDEDRDGIISREEMAGFLKKLGLTGDREAAFLNIVGGDTFQGLNSSERHAQLGSPAASGSPMEPKSGGLKRGSGSGRGSHSGSLSGNSASASASASGTGSNAAPAKVGINFRQFVSRFQDTLEGMDQLEVAQEEDEATIATNPVTIDPSVQFAQRGSPTLAPQSAPSIVREHSPFPEASLLLTPPRAAGQPQLTVNTAAGAGVSGTAVPAPAATGSGASSMFSPSASPASASASALVAAAASPSIRVFLGGACGDTTWRKDDAIPLLVAHGISFYDPQVKDWSPKLVALEGLMKAWCKILLFVIGKQTRALASMIEVAALIASGRRVVLVIEPVEAGVEIEGQVPSASELKDLNRARSYLRDVASNYSIPVHGSAIDGIKAIVAMEEEEKRELKQRLAFLRESSLHTPSASGSSAGGSGGANGGGGGSNAGTPGHRPSYSMAGGVSGGRTRGRSSVMLNGSALALITSGGGGGGVGGGSALSSPASASATGGAAVAGITPSHPHHSHSHGGHSHGHKKMHSQQLHLHGMHHPHAHAHPPPSMMLQHAATLSQLHSTSGGGGNGNSNGGGGSTLQHSHSLSGASPSGLTLTVPPRNRGDSVSSPSSASASAAALGAEPRSGRARHG